jgi:quercetin dioxygenase-like cupin family protein
LDLTAIAALTANDPWRTVRNPLINDEVTFLQTAEETGGAYAGVRVTLAPGGGNDLHFHLDFTEEFQSIEGTLTIECDGQRLALQPGARATAPIGSHHRFANDTDRPVTFVAKITPAHRFEETIRIAYGMARDGKVNKAGLPKNPLQLALLFEIGGTYPAAMPLWLQRAIFTPLIKLARWRKIERTFDKYRYRDGKPPIERLVQARAS